MIDAVIFDFDGTLADTSRDVWRSVEYGFGEAGLALPREYTENKRNLAKTLPEMVLELYPEATSLQQKLAEEGCRVHYRTLNNFANTELYPGIIDVLDFADDKGIKIAVLSNKPHKALSVLMSSKGWDRFFCAIKGSDSDDGDLPKAERIKELAKSNCWNRCAYVGDSPWDISSAKEAEVISVGVTYGDGDGDEVRAMKPDYIAESSEELLAVIKEIKTNS